MGVRYLLDTHVLLWLLVSPERVAAQARAALADKQNVLLVSAASAMEVATKTRLGRLNAGHGLTAAWTARTTEIGAEHLPISADHAVLAGSMTWANRDPFDRFLVAQALRENLILVTVDSKLLTLPGLNTLTW